MVLFGVPPWIAYVILFVFGAVVGSFLNVCIYRIPLHERLRDQLKGLWKPPSHCPVCRHPIASWDNVPIFGWLWLLGRCRHCRTPISPRYPLIELFNALLFVMLYWFEIPTGWHSTVRESCLYSPMGPQLVQGWSDQAFLHWRFVYHLVLVEALLVATMIDIDLKIIPDGCTLPALAVGLLGGWLIGQVYLVPVWSQDPSVMATLQRASPDWLGFLFSAQEVPAWTTRHPHLHGLAVSVAGMLVGGGAVWAVRLIGFGVLRQEAMGFGDVVLMAMIGSFIGWQPVLMVFFIAPACALLVIATAWVVRRPREIPYGPYLSVATLVVILFWKQLWPAAERWFDLGPLVPVTVIFGLAMLGVSLALVQLIKLVLGIPLYPEEDQFFVEEWTPADQLAYLAGENFDRDQGNWKRNGWSGVSAGRGTRFEEQWRRPSHR